MSKNPLLLAILLILFLVCFASVLPHPLSYAFAVSGANIEESKIQAWAKLKYSLVSENEMQDVLKAIAEQVVPAQNLGYIAHNTEDKQGVTLENAHFYATLQTFKSTSETYLLLTWSETNLSHDFEEKIRTIRNVFTALEIEPNISVFLSGTIDDKLTQQEQERIAKKILYRVAARQVEGISMPHMVSLTGYSPLIQDYLRVGRQKVNLNVATTFDEVRNKTVVRLGTPLLNGEY